jgi:hypothetical protein
MGTRTTRCRPALARAHITITRITQPRATVQARIDAGSVKMSSWRLILSVLVVALWTVGCGNPGSPDVTMGCEPRTPGSSPESRGPGGTLVSHALTGPCTIEVEPLEIILRSDSVDPALPVERLTSGLFVSGSHHPGRIAVWGPDGSFLRFLGRPGTGPGELRGLVSVLQVEGEAVHVVDAIGRWTVFGPPELALVRQASGTGGELLRNLGGTVFFEDGPILVGVPFFQAEGVPGRFQLLNREGERLRVFGAPEDSSRGSEPSSLDGAILAKAEGGRFWAATPSAYRIELWDTTGVRHRAIHRDVPWFRGSTVEEAGSRRDGSGLPLQIVSLWEDSSGRVWVTIAIPTGRSPEPEDYYTRLFSEPELFYHWRVEVIDAGTGALLASHDFTRLEDLPVFSRSGISYRYIESAGGARVDLVRVTLRRADP